MEEYTNWENKAKAAIQGYNNPDFTTQQAQENLRQGTQALQKLREILEMPTGKTEELSIEERRPIKKQFNVGGIEK